MSHSVRRHLRLEIDEYDEVIRRFIPRYETMLAVAADAVASTRPLVVVDLGAGTGALSEVLLRRDSIGTVALLDVDPEMLDRARTRLSTYGGRVRFTVGSYDDALGRADAFAASLALHHVRTIEEKASLFARIFDALPPGGIFVNADANMPREAMARMRMYRRWADHLIRSGIAEERAWQHFEEWAEEDTYLPIEDELAALHRIGFNAERTWSEGPIGLVVARKPGGASSGAQGGA